MKISAANLVLLVGGVSPVLSLSGCAGECIARESRVVPVCLRREANGHCAFHSSKVVSVCVDRASSSDYSDSYDSGTYVDDTQSRRNLWNYSARYDLVNRTFEVSYECAQGLTKGRLEIGELLNNAVAGVFYFFPDPTNPGVPSGSHTVNITVNIDDLSLWRQRDYENQYDIFIDPVEWRDQPAGYEMLKMQGKLWPHVFDAERLEIRHLLIKNDGCTVLSVREEID